MRNPRIAMILLAAILVLSILYFVVGGRIGSWTEAAGPGVSFQGGKRETRIREVGAANSTVDLHRRLAVSADPSPEVVSLGQDILVVDEGGNPLSNVSVYWVCESGDEVRRRFEKSRGSLGADIALLSPITMLRSFGTRGESNELGLVTVDDRGLPLQVAVTTSGGWGQDKFVDHTDEPWRVVHHPRSVLSVSTSRVDGDCSIPVMLEFDTKEHFGHVAKCMGFLDSTGAFVLPEYELVVELYESYFKGSKPRGVSLAIAGDYRFRSLPLDVPLKVSFDPIGKLRGVQLHVVDLEGVPVNYLDGRVSFGASASAPFYLRLSGGVAELPCAVSGVAETFKISGHDGDTWSADAVIPESGPIELRSPNHAVVVGQVQPEGCWGNPEIAVGWGTRKEVSVPLDQSGHFRIAVPTSIREFKLAAGKFASAIALNELDAGRINDIGSVLLVEESPVVIHLSSEDGSHIGDKAEVLVTIGRSEVTVVRLSPEDFQIMARQGDELQCLVKVPGFAVRRFRLVAEGQLERVTLAPAIAVNATVSLADGLARHVDIVLQSEGGELTPPHVSESSAGVVRVGWKAIASGSYELLVLAKSPVYPLASMKLLVDVNVDARPFELDCNRLEAELVKLRFDPAKNARGLVMIVTGSKDSVTWASGVPYQAEFLLATNHKYVVIGPECMATSVSADLGPAIALDSALKIKSSGEALDWRLKAIHPSLDLEGRVRRMRSTGHGLQVEMVDMVRIARLDPHRMHFRCEHRVVMPVGSAEPASLDPSKSGHAKDVVLSR